MGNLFGKKKKAPNGGVKIKGAASTETKEYPAFKILMIGDPSVRPGLLWAQVSSVLFPFVALLLAVPRLLAVPHNSCRYQISYIC